MMIPWHPAAANCSTEAVTFSPSIARPQQSVSLSNRTNQELVIKGRHDPCIVPRAVPVVEAAAAIALFDLLLEK